MSKHVFKTEKRCLFLRTNWFTIKCVINKFFLNLQDVIKTVKSRIEGIINANKFVYVLLFVTVYTNEIWQKSLGQNKFNWEYTWLKEGKNPGRGGWVRQAMRDCKWPFNHQSLLNKVSPKRSLKSDERHELYKNGGVFLIKSFNKVKTTDP